MVNALNPGEVVLVPGYIEADRAIKLGRFLDVHCRSRAGQMRDIAFPVRIYDSFAHNQIVPQGKHKTELEEIAERFTDKLDETSKPNTSWLAVMHMQDDEQELVWHTDPNKDIRAMVNVGESDTEVWLWRPSYIPGRDGSRLTDRPTHPEIIRLGLEPGDGYILDNRVSSYNKMPHAVPSNSAGRIMLRYSFEMDEQGPYGPVDITGLGATEKVAALDF